MKEIQILLVEDNEGDIVLTQDILTSYNNYANCFITRPVDFNGFIEVVHTIETFWISIVNLPKRNRPCPHQN